MMRQLAEKRSQIEIAGCQVLLHRFERVLPKSPYSVVIIQICDERLDARNQLRSKPVSKTGDHLPCVIRFPLTELALKNVEELFGTLQLR